MAPPAHFHHRARNEVQPVGQRRPGHAKVEVARHRQIAGQPRIFEVSHARGADARASQAIVEPRRGAVAKVLTDGGLERGQDLQQDEDDAGERERAR